MRDTSTAAVPPPSNAVAAGHAAHHRMDPLRKVALTGGVLYLLTFVASIPQLKLFKNIVDHPARFISTPGSNTAVLWGSWLEVITALAGIGTAVALYPVTRRVSRTAALGFVTSRVVEAGLILVGVLSILSIVTLKAHFAGASGAQADSLRLTGEALADIRKWTFLLGPQLMAGINALFLGYVMYRGRLVPRLIPAIGLIGAPIIPSRRPRSSSVGGVRLPPSARSSRLPSSCGSYPSASTSPSKASVHRRSLRLPHQPMGCSQR